MTKQEFLGELRQALSGEVSPEVVMDSYRYYSDYIDEQIRGGMSEAEVLEELGRPSLIARSIISAKSGQRDADFEFTEDGRSKKIYGNKNTAHREKKQRGEFHFDFNAWYAKLLSILIVIVLVLVVFFILKIGFWILITFGVPILLFLGVLYLVMLFINKS